MSTITADDSAHGNFDAKLAGDVDATVNDHRNDEEIASTIRSEALALGSGKDVIPMTVGIARGKLCRRSTRPAAVSCSS